MWQAECNQSNVGQEQGETSLRRHKHRRKRVSVLSGGLMPVVLLPRGELKLESRQQVQITNHFDRRVPIPGEQKQVDDLISKYFTTTPRTRIPSAYYNCHGLTFASRRTEIILPDEVRKVLKEDHYERIDLRNVLPGDVVIYVGPGGAIDHSGIVVELMRLNVNGPVYTVRIVSKWGGAHEVFHLLNDCPWSENTTVEYYRVTR